MLIEPWLIGLSVFVLVLLLSIIVYLEGQRERLEDLLTSAAEEDCRKSEAVKAFLSVQGYDGNWNYDEYMRGMYNAFELVEATFENRIPDFKSPPEVYVKDRASLSPVIAEEEVIASEYMGEIRKIEI